MISLETCEMWSVKVEMIIWKSCELTELFMGTERDE